MAIKRGVSLYSYQQSQFFGKMNWKDMVKEVHDNLHTDGIEKKAENGTGNHTSYLGQTGTQGCLDGGLHGFHCAQHRKNDPGGGDTVKVYHCHGDHYCHGTFCRAHTDSEFYGSMPMLDHSFFSLWSFLLVITECI